MLEGIKIMVNQIKYPNLINVITTEASEFTLIRSVAVVLAVLFMILYGMVLV